jgi:O-acetylhomoserine (thiol)-lyase
MATQGFTTTIVHGDKAFGVEHGAVHMPVHTSVQYGFDKVEDLIGVFQGTLKGAYNYARQGTPTTAALEAKITKMEDGVGSICFATGMGAICGIFLTLLRAGDHLVASRYVFGNTNSVFGTLRNLGIEVTTVDATDAAAVAAAVQINTRMVFVETIANPGTQIPDFVGIDAVCKAHQLVYVVDNTITSPVLFKPKTVGASLVVNALTKTVAGHGSAMGGAVTDTGLFDWTTCPAIFANYRKGDPRQWGLQQIRKKGLRDMGTAAPRPWRWRSFWRPTRRSSRCITPCSNRTRSTPGRRRISALGLGCCRLSWPMPMPAWLSSTACRFPSKPPAWPTPAR